MNTLLTEHLALLAQANPALANNTTYATAWVDSTKFYRLAFLLAVGATDTTVDAKLQQASDASGTGAADISGKAITQIVTANKQAWINLRGVEVGQAKTYVRLLATVGNGTTGAQLSAVAFGADERYAPANQAASVVQAVV
jgi:hypothetical protein